MPKLCEFENCRKQASYGECSGKPLRCSQHKEEYVLVSTFCEYNGCNKNPTYNVKGEKKRRFCCIHKSDDMINIKDHFCKYNDCKIRPNFNYDNESYPIYCNIHKLPEMIDVKHKTCNYENCKIRPNYNYNTHIFGIYCSNHKLPDMIDVVNKKCLSDGCLTHPIYNYKNILFGIFCNKHKLEHMINVIDKKCKSNLCLGSLANKKFKGYCAPCYQHLFPLDPLTYQIRSKTKEIAVRDYINENFEGFQHDKPLFTGNCDCTHRRRIDHRFLIGNTLLCIETDENQHNSYDKKDEEIRYDDLFMIHSGKFVFIRFNPDKYKNKSNKSVNPMLYTRLPILKEEIEKQMERIKNEKNSELLEIIKLYYDDYN